MKKTMNNLGDFLRVERFKQGLSLGELARLVGYRNINKGIRRITALERTGMTKPDLLVNVAEALNLDWEMVLDMAEGDRQERLREWESWANKPQPMCMVVRMMAAVYARKALPEGITTPEQAEAWACEFAREHRWRVCLVVSRRLSVWIDAFGLVEARTEARPDQPNVPVAGLRFLLEG
jgi:transcriptional regulator with XRE-family HTH domain